MKSLFLLLLSLSFFISCEEQTVSSLENGGATASENANEESTPVERGSLFFFDALSGLCFNEEGESGLNSELSDVATGECTDLSNKTISNIDFGSLSPYGLDLSGATILGEINIDDLIKYQIIFDQYTNFDWNAEAKRLIVEYFEQHVIDLSSTKEKIRVEVDKLREHIAKLQAYIDAGEISSGYIVIRLNQDDLDKLQAEVDQVNTKLDEFMDKVDNFDIKINYLDRVLSNLG